MHITCLGTLTPCVCYLFGYFNTLCLLSLTSNYVHRYPPGHGDVFPSLSNSGKLDTLLSQVDPRAQIVYGWTFFYSILWPLSSLLFSFPFCSYRVKSMCLLPIQITWEL